MGKHWKHLTYTDRLIIEKMVRNGKRVAEIAEVVGCHVCTVYAELKRGRVRQMTAEYEFVERYCADYAEDRYREKLKAKGPGLKIGKEHELAAYIEHRVKVDKLSPRAVVGELDRCGWSGYKVRLSAWTVYKYIRDGVFLQLEMSDIPTGGRKRRYGHVKRRGSRAPAGRSIEKRPADILHRGEFGHWEMDSVVGRKSTGPRLLVLTERRTRREIVRLVQDGSAASVVRALNGLERKCGSRRFRAVFKTITVDNGTEFSDWEGLERSIRGGAPRTRVYYCHPYTSSERGSNEKQNQMLRRIFPKGTDFSKVQPWEIKAAQDWLNQYPRGIFGYETSEERFQAELARIQ